MKRLSSNAACVLFVIVAFVAYMFFTPPAADAKVHDHSDASTLSDALLIAAAVVVIVGMIIMVAKSGDDDKKEESEEKKESSAREDPNSQSLLRSKQGFGGNRKIATHESQVPRLNLYLDIDDSGKESSLEKSALNSSDKTVKVGLSLSF